MKPWEAHEAAMLALEDATIRMRGYSRSDLELLLKQYIGRVLSFYDAEVHHMKGVQEWSDVPALQEYVDGRKAS